MAKEINCLLFDVHNPRLLCIQREAKPIKNLLGLGQINVWPPTTQNHKVISVADYMCIVLPLTVSFAFPMIVQPVEIQVCQER